MLTYTKWELLCKRYKVPHKAHKPKQCQSPARILNTRTTPCASSTSNTPWAAAGLQAVQLKRGRKAGKQKRRKQRHPVCFQQRGLESINKRYFLSAVNSPVLWRQNGPAEHGGTLTPARWLDQSGADTVLLFQLLTDLWGPTPKEIHSDEPCCTAR